MSSVGCGREVGPCFCLFARGCDDGKGMGCWASTIDLYTVELSNVALRCIVCPDDVPRRAIGESPTGWPNPVDERTICTVALLIRSNASRHASAGGHLSIKSPRTEVAARTVKSTSSRVYFVFQKVSRRSCYILGL